MQKTKPKPRLIAPKASKDLTSAISPKKSNRGSEVSNLSYMRDDKVKAKPKLKREPSAKTLIVNDLFPPKQKKISHKTNFNTVQASPQIKQNFSDKTPQVVRVDLKSEASDKT